MTAPPYPDGLAGWHAFAMELRGLLAACSTDGQRRALIEALPEADRRRLARTWRFLARDKQLAPFDLFDPAARGDKTTALALAGRGFGKTRLGSEWVLEAVQRGYRRIALVAETAADARDVLVEGESGILRCAPPWLRVSYEPSKRRLVFEGRGVRAVATTYAAESYEALRGPNHDCALVDELAKYRYDQETWDQLQFTLRLDGPPEPATGRPAPPLTLVTTTPRPTKLIRELVADPSVLVVRGSTFENRRNLSPVFLAAIEKKYAGTRLGRQELYAEVLDDVEGALWTWAIVEAARLQLPELDADRVEKLGQRRALLEALGVTRVVVAVDPSVSATGDGDETGILVVGLAGDTAIVLDDRSLSGSPAEWGKAAADAYHDWHADRVVAEANNGGALVTGNLRAVDRNLPVRLVRASKGKATRAEPVAALYEQGRAKHAGSFPELCDQLTSWTPLDKESPDRLDALVWGVTELLLAKAGGGGVGGDLI